YKYWITFIDAHTRFFVVSFLRKKSDAFEAFKAYKAYAENALGAMIKCTLDDKGGEYVSKEWDAYCVQEGIVRKHTETDEPYQNGISERANQTIQAAVTAMLVEAKLPASFWTYAVRCFVHVHNRLPTSSLSGAIPYSLWKKGKKPDLSYFRVFGSLAYVLIRKDKRKALQTHTRKCIFVGYADRVRAWLFYDPATRKFFNSSNAVFDERCFP
ncbi:ribonuclease H-like protein, partial [Gloeophyllum trabeum ATCC 11539]